MNPNKDDFQLLIEAARGLKKLKWAVVQIKRNSPSYEEAYIRLNYTILEVVLKGNKLTLMEDGVFITSFQIQDFFFMHIVLRAHEALGHSTKKKETKKQKENEWTWNKEEPAMRRKRSPQETKKERPKKIRERFGFLENAVMWINKRIREGYVLRELSMELEDFSSACLVVEVVWGEGMNLPHMVGKKFNNQSDAHVWVLDMERMGYHLKTYSVNGIEGVEFEGDEWGDISIEMKLEEKCS